MGLRATLPVLAVLTALLTGPAGADTGTAKFAVDGDTLTYDSETPGPGETSGIALEDVAIMLDLLRGNEAITRLQLNSSGGELYAASQMSDIVLDFGLDTHIHGDCDSSCVLVFLAGAHRTMSPRTSRATTRRNASRAAGSRRSTLRRGCTGTRRTRSMRT